MSKLKPSLQKLLLERARQKEDRLRLEKIAKEEKKPSVNISSLSYLLKKVANPTRLSVLYLLHKQGEMSVSTMTEILNCEQSLMSHHLSELREIGLLKAERRGQQIFYSVTDKNFSGLLQSLSHLEHSGLHTNIEPSYVVGKSADTK